MDLGKSQNEVLFLRGKLDNTIDEAKKSEQGSKEYIQELSNQITELKI